MIFLNKCFLLCLPVPGLTSSLLGILTPLLISISPLIIPLLTPPGDLSDETPPSIPENVAFHNFDESAILASKLRQHQISGGSSPAAAAAAKLMLQQQFMMATRGGAMPQNDVVDGSSFKSPTQVCVVSFPQSIVVVIYLFFWLIGSFSGRRWFSSGAL